MSGPSEGAIVRRYRPADRATLYAVCLATGADGQDASTAFRDPHLLGHRYVGPYLDLEPRLAFTLEDAQGPCGYVLGTADSERFYRAFLDEWLPPLRERLPEPGPDPARWSEDDRLLDELRSPTLTLPADLGAHPAHLHVDLLPRAQGLGHGRRMVQTLLTALAERGCVGVHLGVSPTNDRAIGFYRALGFEAVPAANPDAGTLLMARAIP
ncbi:MAG: N-acetyltransferase [Trueperaceae bacterium]